MKQYLTCLFLVYLSLLIFSLKEITARVKLTALPERDFIIVRLNNPTATLIEEDRVLTLQKGINVIDFSWKGVSIDPYSIRLILLKPSEKVRLLNVSFPPNEDALFWELFSDEPREEKVRISYLLSGIDRILEYKAILDKEESKALFKSFGILRNFSGEVFKNAAISFEPTTILLKGQEIENEETKRFQIFETPNVPIKKVWVFDALKTKWDPEEVKTNIGIPMQYWIVNEEKVGLGKPIFSGKVRVFQEDGHESTVFSGEDNSPFIAKGEELKLWIGDSRDIVITQRKMDTKVIPLNKRPDGSILLYNLEEKVVANIENFKDKPAFLLMRQYIPGEWEMLACNMPYEKKDAEALEFKVELEPKSKKQLELHYRRLNIISGAEKRSVIGYNYATLP